MQCVMRSDITPIFCCPSVMCCCHGLIVQTECTSSATRCLLHRGPPPCIVQLEDALLANRNARRLLLEFCSCTAVKQRASPLLLNQLVASTATHNLPKTKHAAKKQAALVRHTAPVSQLTDGGWGDPALHAIWRQDSKLSRLAIADIVSHRCLGGIWTDKDRLRAAYGQAKTNMQQAPCGATGSS